MGLFQNTIVLPTTAGVAEQRDALFRKAGAAADMAGQCGVNVLCLQELWRETYGKKFLVILD